MGAPGPRTASLAHGCCRAPLSVQTQDCSAYAHDHRTPSARRRSSVNIHCPRPKKGQALLFLTHPGPHHLYQSKTSTKAQVKHQEEVQGQACGPHRRPRLTVWGGRVPRVLAKLWYICWAVSSRCQPQPATDRASPREQRGSEGGREGTVELGRWMSPGCKVPEKRAGGSGHSSSHRK